MWANWFRTVVIPAPRRSRRDPKTHANSSARRRPALDSLEDRTVPTVFTVNTTADTVDAIPGNGFAADASGNTSLRAAIMEANALAGDDTINLPAGTYTLTLAGANEDAGRAGDLDITANLTILGAAPGTTTVNGNQLDRVFHVIGTFRGTGPTVSIKNLTVTGGRSPSAVGAPGADGGGVLNAFSTLTLDNTIVRNNRAGDGTFAGSGGGVYTAVGTTTIANSTIHQNQAGTGTTVGGHGGGVGSLTSITTIRDSVVSENRSGDGPSASGITAGDGGGIYSASAETFTNGFLTVVNTTVTGNFVGTASRGDGGGIITHDERFLLDNSVVSNNTAWRAGGVEIDITRSARVVNSTIAGNTATGGGAGGIYHTTSFDQLTAPTVIEGTTVSANQAPNSNTFDGGGGMINQGQIGSIVNSTFSGNTTNASGGGIANYDHIGKIVNTTIANNTGGNGGGLFHMLFANVTPVIGELTNTLIGDNTASGTANEDFVQLGTVTVARNNLVETAAGHPLQNGVNGNIVGADAKLGALANNGGPTRTQALLAGSPAVNAGTATGAPATDQRGVARPQGPAVDIGAFEVPGNQPPVAAADAYSVNEDVTLTVNAPGVLANDADPEGGAITTVLVSGPANATTFTLSANGSFTYLGKRNFNGTDSFTYKARDAAGLDGNTVTVTLTVNPVNDAPLGIPQTLFTPEETAISGQARGLDFDNDPLTFSLERGPDHGTVTLGADGKFTYTPALDFNGQDGFLFKVTDPGGASGVSGVIFNVTPVNDAPTVANDAYTVNEDGTLVIGDGPAVSRLHMISDPGDWVGQGLVWDFDPSTATFSARTNFDNGVEVSVDPPGAVERWDLNFAAPGEVPLTPGTYLNATRWPFQAATDPGLDVSGYGRGLNRLVGQFTVYDVGYGATGGVTRFAATFVQQDDPFTGPDGPPLYGAVVFNSTFGAGRGVLANDTDVEGELLLGARLVTSPVHGDLAFNEDGSFVYKPFPNFSGTDTFTYRTADARADSAVATVTINVTAVNDAPVANNGTGTTDEDTALNGTVVATDVDGDTLAYSLVSGPAHGSLTLNANGSFSYTPAANYNGADSFTFKANDGTVDSNTATFDLTVRPINDAPVASNAGVTTDEDTAFSGAVTATDVDGDALTFSTVAGPAHGTLTLNANGTYTYTPAANYNGPDSFTFKANDGVADSNVATVSITVNAVNDAPVAASGSAGTDEDTPLSGNVSATDVDADTLTYAVVTGPAHGTLTLNADGKFGYTPAANYNGPDSFTFKASDGKLDSNTATFDLTVRPINDAPVASNVSATTEEDTALNGSVSATDVDGDTLTYAKVSGPSHGTATVNANGTYVYTPAANYNGPDTFTFKASDGKLDSNTATVSVTVNAVNDAPVAKNDSASTDEDVGVTVAVLANDADVDGDALTVSAVTQPAHGAVVVNADNTVTYTPAADYNGADAFTYTAADGHGGTATATVALSIKAVNDAPVAGGDSATTDEDTRVTIAVLANDTDVDGDALRPVLVAGPSHGTAVINTDGTITYTPAANYNGPDSFTYKAGDGTLNSNVATVSIAVNAVNDAPAAANDSYTTAAGSALDVPAAGVLANDTDVDGDTLSAVLVTGPANGTLTLNADGSFTYTPIPGFSGTDTFTYQAGDGSLSSNVATATVRVTPAGNTEGKVTGGGAVDAGRRKFTVNVQSKRRTNGTFALSGSLSFNDPDNKIKLQSTAIRGFQVDASGTRAVVSGVGTVNGKAGYSFVMMVQDVREPGMGADTFRILITGPNGFAYDSIDYAAALGVLSDGNLQVRKRP